jgi:hypothetical protein
MGGVGTGDGCGILTLVKRNVADFGNMGVRIVSPFESGVIDGFR